MSRESVESRIFCSAIRCGKHYDIRWVLGCVCLVGLLSLSSEWSHDPSVRMTGKISDQVRPVASAGL